MDTTFGAVLAGGLALRMGGGDKPLRHIAGKALLDHVLERLTPQVAGVVLSANGDAGRFAGYGLPVVADGIADSPGPLAGVLATLDWLARERPKVAWMVSVAGDCPLLPPDLVVRLHHARVAAGMPLAQAASGGFAHPTTALWPVSLRHDLRAALLAGERKVGRWAAGQGCARAEWPTEPFDPFFNANTPEELAAAGVLLRRWAAG